MKKGFPADISTPGGRVRKSRLDSGYTIKDFAAQLGISAGHLGLVERGEKQASFKLLQAISTATNTPYQWLIKGVMPEQIQAQEGVPVSAISKPGQQSSPNLQLLFGLILAMTPAISKATLANLLNVPVATIERILSGEDVECDIEWLPKLPTLAGLLGDIPAIRSQLVDLDKFLADIEFDRNVTRLKENLIRYIEEQCGQRYKLSCLVTSHVQNPNAGVEWTVITLCEAKYPENLWYFYVAESPIPGGDEYDDSISEILDFAMDEANSSWNYYSMIFFSENDYDRFSLKADEMIHRLDGADAGNAELGLPSPYSEMEYRNLSYFLVDKHTLEIRDFTCMNDSTACFWRDLLRPTDS